MKTAYAALWLSWVGMFFGVELTAIFTGHDQYTLSEYVWRLERLGTTWTFLRFFLAVFLIWLLLHITLGWFR